MSSLPYSTTGYGRNKAHIRPVGGAGGGMLIASRLTSLGCRAKQDIARVNTELVEDEAFQTSVC